MVKVQSLNGTWNLHKNEETSYIPAAVPGTVLHTMLEGGVIEDPYWRCSEYQVREFMTSDFVYERRFLVEDLEYESVCLVCEGLDTIAELTLNGRELARVEVCLIDSNFNLLEEQGVDIRVKPMSVEKCLETNCEPWLSSEYRKSSVFSRVRLLVEGSCVSERVTLFVKPKHFDFKKPVYEVLIKEQENWFEIHVKSSSFACYVELELEDSDPVFSDNYFDITGPEGKTVIVKKSKLPQISSGEGLKKQLKIRSVADTFD